jgi:iron-sulfur cluster repair protein YtfE (RIC family)
MKRHKAIIPLSQDHHQALRFATAMQKNASPTKRALQTIPEKLEDAKRTYTLELIPHFKHEEEILFPIARGYSGELDKALDSIIEEHNIIAEAFENIEVGNLEDNLDRIGKLVEQHVRTEERILFQLIQRDVPDEKLKEIIGKIDPVKDTCDI